MRTPFYAFVVCALLCLSSCLYSSTEIPEVPREPAPLPEENAAPYPLYEISVREPRTGEPVTFDGRLARDPDGLVVAWQWSIGNWPVQTAPVVVVTFDAPGAYPVSLTVIDDDGASSNSSSRRLLYVTDADPGGCDGGRCH